jgi:hypothetical protein
MGINHVFIYYLQVARMRRVATTWKQSVRYLLVGGIVDMFDDTEDLPDSKISLQVRPPLCLCGATVLLSPLGLRCLVLQANLVCPHFLDRGDSICPEASSIPVFMRRGGVASPKLAGRVGAGETASNCVWRETVN